MARTLPGFNLSDFTRGLALPFKGMRFLLANPGLKRYAILPLILNVILYALAIGVFFHFLWNWRLGPAEWEFWGPVGGWLARAADWMGWLVKLAAGALGLAAAFFTFTAVGMVLASPLNDILSEKVEDVYRGGARETDLPLRFTVAAALLSFCDSLRNLAKQLVCTVAVLPFLLAPVVGFVPLFLVGGYFAGFGFIDSAMARNFLRPKHKKLLADERFWEIVGFGVAMQAIFAIPFLGMLLMPVGVASGTLLYCSADWQALFDKGGMKPPGGFALPRKDEAAAGRAPAAPDGPGNSL